MIYNVDHMVFVCDEIIYVMCVVSTSVKSTISINSDNTKVRY